MPKKEKKSKRDIGKKELHRLLYDIFSGNPDQNFNYKQLAQRLGIKNMNAKQLIMTVLNEMKNDNMLTEESTGVFKFKVNTIYVTGTIDLNGKRHRLPDLGRLQGGCFHSPSRSESRLKR